MPGDQAHGAVLAVISAGGALGALGRYGLSVALPTAPGGFPLATFLINVGGCLLIGVVMVLITERHRLLRPFLTVGVLGGFTTFSAYAEEVRGLLRPEWTVVGLAYLVGTLVGAMLAVWVGMRVARVVVR